MRNRILKAIKKMRLFAILTIMGTIYYIAMKTSMGKGLPMSDKIVLLCFSSVALFILALNIYDWVKKQIGLYRNRRS